ncbi:MAG: hypothetical protein MRQ13_05520 [Candidatus Midichloria sp.]|nr:hypothetical protein [Candidatus Midichloria sp.]
MAKEFKQEMQRFLPVEQISQTLAQEIFSRFIVYLLVEDLINQFLSAKHN